MVMPSTAITRYELSLPFTEFDLLANQKGYVGPTVLRRRAVALQSADVGKLKIEDLLQLKNTKRAASAGYKRGDFEFTKFSYSTEEFGWEEAMDDRTLAMFADMIDAEMVHAQRAADFVLQQFERDVVTALYDTAVWTGAALTTSITNEWDDHTLAVPITDIIAAREKIVAGCGMEPNALIMNAYQFRHACNCDQIVERVKYTQRGDQETMQNALADVLGLDRIIVAGLKGGGIKNTAVNPTAASTSRIWDSEYMMLAKIAETDDPQEPCVGRTFMWNGDGNPTGGGDETLALILEEYREEGVRGSVLRARNDRAIVIMYPEAAHLLSNAITI